MPYTLFYDVLPDLAMRETRSLIVPPGGASPLPPDSYSFCEMFCDEPGCDCRRVMFMVVSDRRPGEILAVIAYGWESRAFYARWMRDEAPEVIAELVGPVLNLGSPQSELAPALLACFISLLLPDTAFMNRVKRHYRQFRAQIERGALAPPATPVRLPPRPQRNAPCPCGSGKKFKHCCGAPPAP